MNVFFVGGSREILKGSILNSQTLSLPPFVSLFLFFCNDYTQKLSGKSNQSNPRKVCPGQKEDYIMYANRSRENYNVFRTRKAYNPEK